MILREYITKNSIKIEEFGAMVGIKNRSRVSQLIGGFRLIPLELAKKIELVTEGAVTRLELLYPEEYANNR